MKGAITVLTLAILASASSEQRGLMDVVTKPISTITALFNGNGPAPVQCVPPSPINITALRELLPNSMKDLATEDNLKVVQNVGTLAQLSTSAATGNPVAIVKLVVFLASKDDPIVPLYNLGKQMLPRLNASEVTSDIKDAYHNAVDAVTNLVNKKPANATAKA